MDIKLVGIIGRNKFDPDDIRTSLTYIAGAEDRPNPEGEGIWTWITVDGPTDLEDISLCENNMPFEEPNRRQLFEYFGVKSADELIGKRVRAFYDIHTYAATGSKQASLRGIRKVDD